MQRSAILTVNPDEVVAVGGATQAAIIKGETKNVLLLDVTPLWLGVEAPEGMMSKVLERNTTIHARRAEMFSTAEDNQLAVHTVVRGRVTDNRVPPADHTTDEAVEPAEARMSGEPPSHGTLEAPLRRADVVVARQ